MPDFIKEHLSAVLLVVGAIVGFFGLVFIQAGPPTLEYIIGGAVLIGIAVLMFVAARQINPSDPTFHQKRQDGEE